MKIFEMNDCEWWRAPSLEEAITAMMDQCGTKREDIVREGYPRELTDAELDTLKYVESEPDTEEPEAGWPERTFREQCKDAERVIANADRAYKYIRENLP